jgi:hypothetical protein
MRSAKAWTGGVTVAAAQVLLYFLDMLPVVAAMPADVHGQLELLLTAGLVSGAVYLVPNKER